MALAVLVRLGFFLWTILFPIANEMGHPTSPLHFTGVDMEFYYDSVGPYFRDGLGATLARIVARLGSGQDAWLEIATPGVPALMLLTDYRPDNTLPLAILYLLLGIALAISWLCWLRARGLSFPWLVGFALLPNPLWYTVAIGSDLPFALCVMLFCFAATRGEVWGMLAALFLAIMMRPHGAALAVALPLMLSLQASLRRRHIVVVAMIYAAVVLAPAPIYVPYFLKFVADSLRMPFYGAPGQAYFDGLLPALPRWLDFVLSCLALAVAKVGYFVGLRPSYGETSLPLVVLRALPGLLLLPGVLYLCVGGRMTDRVLAAAIALPAFIGASQDRYNLAIQPILYLYGALLWQRVWTLVARLFPGQPNGAGSG